MAVNKGLVAPSKALSPAGKAIAKAGVTTGLGNGVTTPAAAVAGLSAASPVGGKLAGTALTAGRWGPRLLGTEASRHAGMNTLAGATAGGLGGMGTGDDLGVVNGAAVGAVAGRFGAKLAPASTRTNAMFGSNKYLAPGLLAGGAAGAATGSVVPGGLLAGTAKAGRDVLGGTLAEAVEKLAHRAADLRTRPVTYAEKTATSASDVLSSLGGSLKDNPTLGHALLGGGLGAAAGAGATAFGNRGKEDYERRGLLGGALTGGLAGAGIGAGVGLARQGLAGLGADKPPAAPGLPHGEYTDPTTGKRMMVPAETLEANPGLRDQIHKLRSSAPGMQTVNAVGGTIWNTARRAASPLMAFGKSDSGADPGANMPVSSSVLPAMLAGDVALNSQSLRLGDRLGWGAIDPRNSRNVNHLRRGLQEAAAAPGKFFGEHATDLEARSGLLARLKQRGGKALDALAAKPGRGFSGSTTKDVETQVPGQMQKSTKEIRDASGNVVGQESHESPGPATTKKTQVKSKTSLTPAEVGDMRDLGARTLAGEAGKNKALGEGVSSEARVHRSLGGIFGKGKDTLKQTSPLGWKRLGMRVPAYAAIPAAEAAAGSLMDERSRDQQMHELAAKFARPVPGQ